jgi:hypothetical protein
MLFFKTILAVFMTAVMYAPSTLAVVDCEATCASAQASNVCGNQHAPATRIHLDSHADPNPKTKVLTSGNNLEVVGHFDTGKIQFFAKACGQGHYLFDIQFGNGDSATYKLMVSDFTCQQDMAKSATSISGSAIYSPTGRDS